MAALIRYGNIINFDIGYLKAGCYVGKLTFLEMLWSVARLFDHLKAGLRILNVGVCRGRYTMLLLAITAAVFVLAALVRAWITSSKAKSRLALHALLPPT